MSFRAPRFADRKAAVAHARQIATSIAAAEQVHQIILFGSFARGDYGVRSDLDLLVILKASNKALRERTAHFLQYVSGYPTDILPLTEAEVEERLADGDPFLCLALSEGIQLYPVSGIEREIS